MFNKSCAVSRRGVFLVVLVLTFPLTSQAQVELTRISTDSFTNSSSQHASEVEPSTFAFGNTIVSVFQEGRYATGGGSSDNGWATSLDGGTTWQHGVLPRLTTLAGGPYDRVSDPAVTYDAAHGVWLIASLPYSATGQAMPPMLVSRSTDGVTWQNPVIVGHRYHIPDKTWISCDNNTGSPFYGHCYAEWDDNFFSDTIYLSVSTDGGNSWSAGVKPSGNPIGLGLQALAQPNGTVIAPGADAFLTSILAVTSTDGGATWGSAVTVSSISSHAVGGGLRDLVLPSSAMDASGTIYVVWQDCRFRTNCSSNDLVMSTSTDGQHWTAVQRIPIDDVTSNYDHFIPGLAIEPGTSGASAHLGLAYYFYPRAGCSLSCELEAGYISSSDGGTTWGARTGIVGMEVSWLPSSNQGAMVGDYESLAFVQGKAYPVFAVAKPNSGSTFNESMVTATNGLTEDLDLYSSEGEKPVPNAHSDHLPRSTPVCDNCADRE